MLNIRYWVLVWIEISLLTKSVKKGKNTPFEFGEKHTGMAEREERYCGWFWKWFWWDWALIVKCRVSGWNDCEVVLGNLGFRECVE